MHVRDQSFDVSASPRLRAILLPMFPTSFDPHPFERAFQHRRPIIHGVRMDCDGAGYVRQLVEHADDLNYLRSYREACNVAGASPEDYAPRLVRLNDGCTAIAGIHFRGLDTDFPFIDISACDGDLPENIDVECVTNEFEFFRPRAIRLWVATWERPPKDATEDLLVLASPISPLLSFPAPPHIERVRIEPDERLDYFDDYRALYRELNGTAPELAGIVAPEDHATLASCAQAGGFSRVLIDGRRAGFIAARPGSYRCWKGWEMIDEILAAEFRGCGFAPAMQFAFLHTLDLQRSSSIFGTIASRNLPSIMTARRVGREVVETGYFIRTRFPSSELNAPAR